MWTGGSGTLDLDNFVMHSTGTTDSGRIVFAVLTLASKSRPYDSAAMIITGLTKSLYDNVIFNRQPVSDLKFPVGHNKNLTILQSGPILEYRLAKEGAVSIAVFDHQGRTFYRSTLSDQGPGLHTVHLSGQTGSSATGLYLYSIGFTASEQKQRK